MSARSRTCSSLLIICSAPALNISAASAAPAPAASPSASAAATAAPAAAAPALKEAYQDWQVVCAQPLTAKRCEMVQLQEDSRTHARAFSIELVPSGGQASGAMTLPFGIDLEKPITLQSDTGAVSASTRVRTCVPAGCLAPVTIPAKDLVALRGAGALAVKVAGYGGKEVTFNISLKGLGPALDRTVALLK